MPLFQSTVLKKYTNALDTATVDAAYERFSAHFHNAVIQENIRLAKEEQYQGEFLIDLFVKVLGYVKNPTPDFNLTTEFKNIKDSKKADGAILTPTLSQGEGVRQVLAVIELKGTAVTDLGRIEVQAFGYKNNQPGCVYVITSNFEKLRFYIDNAVDFEEFNLFQLSRERFHVLWLCLSAEQLLAGKPKQLKEESLSQEEQITKQLYKDYSLFRNEVFQNIVDNNPQYDKLTLFKETQKLLDRFLFIFFAEDRLLLPPNSILAIVEQWKDLRDKYDAYTPLYDRFKKYFGYLNTGHKGQKHDIFAYNGGLFTPDPILDDLTIDDDLLYKHTVKLTHYDFESEVSVNILGHIFEHSLNEIEEIQAELEGQTIDKSSSKRKKDGVFYTPKYITKYIVDNTVGKLCEEQKAALGIEEAEYDKGRKNRPVKVVKALKQKLDDYRAWLLQLTICDPACGSGAFLNQALEFLIAEHAYVDELQAKLFGDALVLSDVENSILEHNLYGVDINNESVEIAKLSLWLRTAQKGRKLTSLNNNIKCGNSLIDDPAVAGDKAFDWEQEFPQVFSRGAASDVASANRALPDGAKAKSGFDVVIGNPPYVQSIIKEDEKAYYANKYFSNFGKPDLYRYFIEKGLILTKENGMFSFITPNSFLTIPAAKRLREFLKNNGSILKIINFEGMVFSEASINTVIFVIEKVIKESEVEIINDNSKLPSAESLYKSLTESNFISHENYLKDDEINIDFTNKILSNLLRNIEKNTQKLSEVANYTLGLQVYHNTLHSQENIKERIYHNTQQLDGTYIPEIGGKHLSRYSINLNHLEYVSIGEWCYNKPSDYFLTGERIFIREIPSSSHLICTLFSGLGVPNKAVIIVKSDIINIKTLLGILNSKLIGFYIHKTTEKGKQKLFPRISLTSVRNIPIPYKKDEGIDLKVDKILSLRNDFNKISEAYLDLLTTKFPIDNPSRNLQSWHTLDFKGFLKELKKARVSLTLPEEAEWMAYFNAEKEKAQALQNEINRLDKEIDGMVYGLYGLTEEEIAIVESA